MLQQKKLQQDAGDGWWYIGAVLPFQVLDELMMTAGAKMPEMLYFIEMKDTC